MSDSKTRWIAWRRDIHKHPELGFKEEQVHLFSSAPSGAGEQPVTAQRLIQALETIGANAAAAGAGPVAP